MQVLNSVALCTLWWVKLLPALSPCPAKAGVEQTQGQDLKESVRIMHSVDGLLSVLRFSGRILSGNQHTSNFYAVFASTVINCKLWKCYKLNTEQTCGSHMQGKSHTVQMCIATTTWRISFVACISHSLYKFDCLALGENPGGFLWS